MNAIAAAEQPANVVALPKQPRKRTETQQDQQFKIKAFLNASGTESYRVDGYKRNGTRIRMNFADKDAAQAKRIELETEYFNQAPGPATVKATRLTDTQISLAEAAFLRLGSDMDLPLAVEYWISHGRQNSVQESPRLDDAVKQFEDWLETSSFRDRTRTNLSTRVNVFKNSVPNMRVADVTPEVIDGFLDARNVQASTKDNDRRAISRFFSFCMDRKRRWAASNPCKAVKVEKAIRDKAPDILSINDCAKLLRAAEAHRGGRLAPYAALCLFGGLRPFEAARLKPEQLNLKDGEIRLEAWQTKTKTPRVVTISDTLKKWLKAYEGKPIYPKNWRRDFDEIKACAGFGNIQRFTQKQRAQYGTLRPWPDDVMRHTAISHYFRLTGSYGQTAEQFGNSEAIIKKHYQGRVSSEDTRKFYSILPRRK